MDNRITSIEITSRASGPYFADEMIAETLKIYRHGKLRHLQYNGLSEAPVNEFEYKVGAAKINTFFEQLISKIKANEWVEDYSVPVCDGWSWEFKMRHSSNTVKKVIGTVEPPPKGHLLKKSINMLVNFKVEPWIF